MYKQYSILDWHQYAVESLEFQWNDNVKPWIQDIQDETEERLLEYTDNLNLPKINLLYANPRQRVIIAISEVNENLKPLSLQQSHK